MANSLNHVKVKPEKLAATAVELMERELVVPKLFTRKGIEEFKGAKDDTINIRRAIMSGVTTARSRSRLTSIASVSLQCVSAETLIRLLC